MQVIDRVSNGGGVEGKRGKKRDIGQVGGRIAEQVESKQARTTTKNLMSTEQGLNYYFVAAVVEAEVEVKPEEKVEEAVPIVEVPVVPSVPVVSSEVLLCKRKIEEKDYVGAEAILQEKKFLNEEKIELYDQLCRAYFENSNIDGLIRVASDMIAFLNLHKVNNFHVTYQFAYYWAFALFKQGNYSNAEYVVKSTLSIQNTVGLILILNKDLKLKLVNLLSILFLKQFKYSQVVDFIKCFLEKSENFTEDEKKLTEDEQKYFKQYQSWGTLCQELRGQELEGFNIEEKIKTDFYSCYKAVLSCFQGGDFARGKECVKLGLLSTVFNENQKNELKELLKAENQITGGKGFKFLYNRCKLNAEAMGDMQENDYGYIGLMMQIVMKNPNFTQEQKAKLYDKVLKPVIEKMKKNTDVLPGNLVEKQEVKKTEAEVADNASVKGDNRVRTLRPRTRSKK